MDNLPISRINVETEADWLRIKDNVDREIGESMEARFSTLPGGTEGEQARALRTEVESRLQRVSLINWIDIESIHG